MRKTEDLSDKNERNVYTEVQYIIPRQDCIDCGLYDENIFSKQILVGFNWQVRKLAGLNDVSRVDEQTIFQSLMNNWIYRFGKPMSILNDRVQRKYFTERMKRINIAKQFGSPYQHHE